MLEQDQEKLQRRNKELDDAYKVTGLMLTKAEDLAQQWADSLGNAETQLNERNIELKNAQDQLVLYRQAVKPHQDHGQVLQDEEDIMALQQLQTADEDLHAKFVNLEQEQHQTLKANKIFEVEVAKKQETAMNLAEQLVTGPKAPSFAEESAIAKMQKDLDILEEHWPWCDMLSQGQSVLGTQFSRGDWQTLTNCFTGAENSSAVESRRDTKPIKSYKARMLKCKPKTNRFRAI
ncbi:hypothetical protein B0H14DRAFT_2645179 [Mycena olivaceomarginata]|nr:hypothetical protein B0H14DRAFT_2645179 [Mycena olivaceomarginata]